MSKNVIYIGAAIIAILFAIFFFSASPAPAGQFEGCTNTWVGNKLIKVGTCNLGYSKSKTGKVTVEVTKRSRNANGGITLTTKTVEENRP